MPSHRLLAVTLLIVLTLAVSVLGQAARQEPFDGPEPTWRAAGGNARWRIVEQRRLPNEGRTGGGCEFLRIQGEGGTTAYVSHAIGRPRIIPELAPSVWVKSDRPGLQLEVRVVLPRSEDPRTGRPVVTVLSGASYNDVGRWQQLRLDDLPLLLNRQIRVLRTQIGPSVDGREAYLGEILLNVYGGPGATTVWIDDLNIAGYAEQGPTPEVASLPRVASPSASRVVPVAGTEPRLVEMTNSILQVSGRPFFPRIIQYQGEPLTVLKQLGFNSIWISHLPAPELLDEARRVGLWVICPPPRAAEEEKGTVPFSLGRKLGQSPAESTDLDAQVAPLPAIGPQYAGVLAWDFGWGLTQEHLESTKRWAEQVRMADRQGRPLVCRPDTELRGYSRHADLLLLDRRPLGTSMELTDYGAWIRQQQRLARPGTPVWTTIQTQLSPALRRQLAALDPNRAPPSTAAVEQIRLLAYSAVAAGSRGLLLLSDSPLTADDPDTRQRAMICELLNLELDLIEPWAAGGTYVTNVEASEKEVTGAVLRADRSRLAIPLWYTSSAQFCPAQAAANNLGVVVPGAPEATNCYELGPGGIQAVRHRRATGGERVTLDEFGLTALVLLAHDPLIVNNLTQRATAIGPRAAELTRNLAARKLSVVQELSQQLGGRTVSPQYLRDWLQTARENLVLCDARLAAKEYAAACVHAQRAMRAMRLIERSYWDKAVDGLPAPLSSPGTASFASLAAHWRLAERLGGSRLGPNRLPAGDFENLDAMLQAGWRHIGQPIPGVESAGRTIADAPHSGRSCLSLTVAAKPAADAVPPYVERMPVLLGGRGRRDADSTPAVIDRPPTWVATPPIAVEAGQVVCVRGWVSIAKPLAGSVDGLMIVDSLSGDDMALRITKTDGWQQFSFYRVATQSGPMTVAFVLTGLGEVRLDDIAIQVLEPLSTARR
jgi:hypothetical protein